MANEITKAEKKSLSGLVDYQTGSIVSRIIIGKEQGSVTLFAFDSGQSLAEHTTPFDALVEVVDGQAEIIIKGESHVLAAGQIIVMPANVPHAVKAPQKFKMLLTMIRG